MGALFDKIAEWLKGILVDASMENLTNLFDSVNEEVQSVAGQVGTSPAQFSPSVFTMIKNISETVILPIAGVILTFIACYELIQLVTDHNNLAQLDTWIIFKWVYPEAPAQDSESAGFRYHLRPYDRDLSDDEPCSYPARNDGKQRADPNRTELSEVTVRSRTTGISDSDLCRDLCCPDSELCRIGSFDVGRMGTCRIYDSALLHAL